VALSKGGLGFSGLKIIPHASMYVAEKVTGIGTSYDVINPGLWARPETLEDEKAKTYFLGKICEFSLLQYTEWYTTGYLTSELVPQMNGAWAGSAFADFEELGLNMNLFRFGTGYVNCFKFTAISAFEAWGISKLNM
jgi:hypothetical protein